jgi:hypothetical protein
VALTFGIDGDSASVALQMDRAIRSARKYLLLSNQIRMRQQGFLLLRVCLATMLRLPDGQSTTLDGEQLRTMLDAQREVKMRFVVRVFKVFVQLCLFFVENIVCSI